MAETIKQTLVIPNPFKIDRNGHATPAASARNKQRQAGLVYSKEEFTESSPGTSDVVTDTESLGFFTFQHYDPITIEARFDTADSDDDSGATDEEDTDFNISIGSLIPNSALAIGLSFEHSKNEDKVTNIDSRTQTLTVNAVMELTGDMLLGLGVAQTKNKETSDKGETFIAGLGKSSESLSYESSLAYANEDGKKIYFFVNQLAKNIGNNQFIGEFNVLHTESNGDKLTAITVAGGYHFAINKFFIQPELQLGLLDNDETNNDRKAFTVYPSVEAGFRHNSFKAFGRINISDIDLEGGDEKAAEEFVAGAQLYF